MHVDCDGNNRAISVVGPDITYDEFLDRFLHPLQPCIITGLTNSWPAIKEWTTIDTTSGNLVPNCTALRDTFGTYDGCITFCGEVDGNGGFNQREMSVAQFIDEFRKNNDEGRSRRTYLKDFHFMRVNPSLRPPYTVPIYFQDDWFNRFALANNRDDFRFLYLGEDGSFTPLHHDVCMSHSWSTSLCGIKVWTLICPDHAGLLYDSNGLLPTTINSTEPKFKNIEKAREVAMTVIQHPGETIFVPSGWHHQVVNQGPTLSLNHNWFNAACLKRMYDSLCREYTLSTFAIRDLKTGMDAIEFEELVQGLLKANYGMDWNSWWEHVEWNFKNWGDGPRMCRDREREIVLDVVVSWLARAETKLIPGVKDRVLALREFLV